MADARSTSWWRIEVRTVAGTPRVVSCERVAAAERDTIDVFYVRAANRAEAGRKAWNEYMRLAQRRRRAQLVAEGKCPWCTRPNDRPAGKRCKVCLGEERRREGIQRAAARGEEVELPNRVDAIAARAAEERAAIRVEAAAEARLNVLLEVQENWQQAQNNAAFTGWLKKQIEALAGRRVA